MSEQPKDNKKDSGMCPHGNFLGNPDDPCTVLKTEGQQITQSHKAKERKKFSPEDVERLKRTAYTKMKEAWAEGDDVNFDLMLANIDWKVGERFDGHGITKIGIPNQLEQLFSLLEKGIDPKRPFHTAPLEVDPKKRALLGPAFGTAGGTATKDGSFMILGGPDRQLREGGIKYVIVNDAYYEAIPDLQQAYPDVEFIRADAVPKRLQKVVEAIDKAKENK